MIQIPVLSITEADGVFTFQGPGGMAVEMNADGIEEEARTLIADYETALRIARCHWWMTRKDAADKAAHDAEHCRLITWSPDTETAVAYGD
jgi:hypothetical protein